MRLAHDLYDYVAPNRIGAVDSPGAIIVPPGLEFQPDILVTPYRAQRVEWTEIRDWWLAVEVLSFWTRATDLGSKRSCYLDLGVHELWLVDPDARSITIARRDIADRVVPRGGMLTWQAPGVSESLTIDLGELFANV